MNAILYGAYGYTGSLIAQFAAEQKIPLTLAGRNEAKTKEVATRFGFDYCVFDLEDVDAIRVKIKSFDAVLHTAGPFIHTAKNMMEACIAEKVHYLDITGEIPVFERAASLGSRAEKAGIILIPGTGFDVVPTDCMAVYLSQKLPDATHLKLAFATFGGRVSHGTAMTAIENLGMPGAVRQEGRIVPVPSGNKTLTIPFGANRERFCMSIPWGDVSTAFYSTGIPNIETYMGIKEQDHKMMVFAQKYLGFLLRSKLVKAIAKNRINQMPAGPSDEERIKGRVGVWGEVSNANGIVKSARIEVPEGYTLTAMSSLHILQNVMNGNYKPGFQTPAGLYGAKLITDICGSVFEDL